MNDKYPWLYQDNERRNMLHKDIRKQYVDLEKSCLLGSEKKQVMDMSYKYKETFSLRDETGTYPNIEVEINVTDTSLFFIRPYHIKERK